MMTTLSPSSARHASARPGWWVTAAHELKDLWLGGRGLTLLLIYSILLGLLSFLFASNAELKLLPPREIIFLVLQMTIAVGLFVGLLLTADAISGERDRATLEALLLVPTGRRALIFGKFLAAVSFWPAALAIATVHMAVLAPNQTIFFEGLLLMVTLGTLLALGFAAFGMLLSLWARSNRTSLIIAIFATIMFTLPTQTPGTAQTGYMGRLVKRINPVESVNQIAEKMLVNNRTLDEMASWLASPLLFSGLALFLLFWYAAPRLDLDGERIRRWRSRRRERPARTAVVVVLLGAAFAAGPSRAQATGDLHIDIDLAYREVRTGDTIAFNTRVTNEGAARTGPMIVAMNIVNLGIGDPVDPEDWSPERTQEVAPLAPGETAVQAWTINAILEGDYLAYMVVIPAPGGPRESSQPVASPGLHLTVAQFSPLNPGGVAPVAAGFPVLIGLLLAATQARRRRQVALPG